MHTSFLTTATLEQLANYITNTGCSFEAQAPGDTSWIIETGSAHTVLAKGYQIRIALTEYGLPSHLSPRNPANTPAEVITEGGYRAWTVMEYENLPIRTSGPMLVECWEDSNWDDTGWEGSLGHRTYRVPVSVQLPDWEEKSKAQPSPKIEVIKEATVDYPYPTIGTKVNELRVAFESHFKEGGKYFLLGPCFPKWTGKGYEHTLHEHMWLGFQLAKKGELEGAVIDDAAPQPTFVTPQPILELQPTFVTPQPILEPMPPLAECCQRYYVRWDEAWEYTGAAQSDNDTHFFDLRNLPPPEEVNRITFEKAWQDCTIPHGNKGEAWKLWNAALNSLNA